VSKPDKKVPTHHAVLKLRVVGGFLGGIELEFADGLNCLIGGRGTGKTTALEFLRFGLGLMPDPKISPQRARAIETLVKANLGGGRLSVELRTKSGMRYTAERGATEAIQVINEAGTAVPVVLDRDQIFGADVFSQNEIEEIASNPAAQLGLLDRFIEAETSTIARDLESLDRQIGHTSVELRRLDLEIDDLAARASELPVLEEKLKGVAKAGGPDAQKINAAHAARAARERESNVPAQLVVAMQRVSTDVSAAATAFQATLGAQLDASVRSGTNSEIFLAMDASAREYERTVVAATRMVAEAAIASEAAMARHQATLAERHALQEAEFRRVVAESQEEGGRAAERAALQASQSEATAAAKLMEAKKAQRDSVVTRRNEFLGRISELRDSRFAARKAVVDRLTRRLSIIRVTVSQAADSKQYRELIAKTLKGLPLKQGPTADRLAEAFLPAELAQAALSRNIALVCEKTGYDEERSRRIVEALRGDGAAYDIEAIDLDDVPCIELLDGDNYKASQNLSTGQRCTTILPILLVQSERPLLIDQPEDNLDNAFIYETIVKALRAVRETRQVIFVTHNPNIPVLGEADRVFVLHSDGHKATVRRFGSVDDCKEDIETILEGGREAFMQRKTRYGH
jgi:hypothetical protein